MVCKFSGVLSFPNFTSLVARAAYLGLHSTKIVPANRRIFSSYIVKLILQLVINNLKMLTDLGISSFNFAHKAFPTVLVCDSCVMQLSASTGLPFSRISN